jgi:hypothetical protein
MDTTKETVELNRHQPYSPSSGYPQGADCFDPFIFFTDRTNSLSRPKIFCIPAIRAGIETFMPDGLTSEIKKGRKKRKSGFYLLVAKKENANVARRFKKGVFNLSQVLY